jgi:hypothetical protein
MGTGNYTSCIKDTKAKAQTQETKCQSICAGMVLVLSTLETALTGVNPALKQLADQTTDTGDGNNNGNDNNAANTNNNVTSGNYNGPASTSSSIGSLIGADQSGNLSNSGIQQANTNPALGQGAGVSSTGSGLGGAKGSASQGTEAEKGSSFAEGGAVVASSSTGTSAASADSQLKGITKNSIDKKDLLNKDADLFATVQKIHSDLYTNKVIGKDAVTKVSKKPFTTKVVR